MAFTDTFIKRPVFAICVNILVLLAGFQAIRMLNVRQYPKSDIAVAVITTPYVGANADLVRGFVTTPLERVIASADGIDYLESTSKQGVSIITAHLKLNYDTNAALSVIQSKISQVRNELPAEAESPAITIETSDNRFASMYLSFYSDILDQNQITDYLTRAVQPVISSIGGVQKADILGARTFAMRIWLKPDRLAAYKVSPREIEQALVQNNYLSAVGSTKGSLITVNLVAKTDLHDTQGFKNLVVAKRGDALIRLSDLADVVLGAESYDEDVRFDGKKATFMGVWVLPTANSLDVIKKVREIIPSIEERLPSGMKVGIPYDATKYINDAINEVIKTLLETIFIVIIVIYLFLGSFRSVFIPIVAIPLSLIGAAAIMLLAGFTVNLLTLLAIVLSVGLVVDDAIVMLENIERHVHEGMKPFDAAMQGARELFGPTIAMTITLAAVYAPIALQGGLTGTLFREFALTLAGAVMVSGFVALTLSPMMCSKILKEREAPTRLQIKLNNILGSVSRRYGVLLDWVLGNKSSVIAASVATLLILVPLYMFTKQELAPREDQGVVFGIVQASPNASLDHTALFADKINGVFESYPEKANTFQLMNPTFGFSGMVTKPWSERKRHTETISAEMWGKMSVIPGVRVIVTTPPPLPGGGDFPVEFIIASTAEPREIQGFAQDLVMKAFQSGLFMFADTDLKYDQPQSELVIDRDKAALLGLTLEQIGSDLGTLLGGNYTNRFSMQGRSYKVIPQLKRSFRLNPDELESLYITGSDKMLIPVSTVATIKNNVEPRQLNRFQQLNSAKIQGSPVPGVSIDAALSFLEKEARMALPKGYVIDYAGESRQLRKEGSALAGTLLIALLVIYLVLAAQFESFKDPFIILTGSVPLALSGALMFVFLDFTSLNTYSQVGLITLVGLIAKNGILIVEFANNLREKGASAVDAVKQAATVRLRPILMTTAATVIGHFPLVLAAGAGAGSRNSIGIVLVTGMIIGTCFTLLVVPVLYTIVHKR